MHVCMCICMHGGTWARGALWGTGGRLAFVSVS